MKNLIKNFITFSNRRPFVLLIIMIMLTTVQIFYLKDNFHVNSDLQALFDGDNETVRDLKQLSDRIGSIDTLSVISKAKSKETNIKFLKKLIKELEKEKMVQYVEFEQDISYLEERALLFLSTEELTKTQKKVQAAISKEVKKSLALDKDDNEESESKGETTENSLEKELDDIITKIDKKKAEYTVQKYYANNDGTMMEIKIHPNIENSLNMAETKKMINRVESIVRKVDPAKYGVEIETGGDFKSKLKQTATIQNDLISTVALCVFLLALTIIFYFKTFSSIFIILLPLSFGIISGISGSLFIIHEFSLISAFSFAMLYGLGIDFAIHLLSRYSEERASGKKIYESLIITYSTTISSIFSGALTTSLAFLSLVLVQFKGFSDFGIVAGIGVLTSLVAITAFFPAFIVIFEKIKPVDKMPRKITFLSKYHKFLIKHSKASIITASILLLISVASAFLIKFEYNMGNLSYPHKEVESSLYYKYQQSVKGEKRNLINRTTPNYILTDSIEESKDAYNSAEKLVNVKTPGNHEFVRAVMSIFTFIPDDQDHKLKIIARTKRLIERKINLFSDSVKSKIETKIFPLLDIKEKIEIDKLPTWIKDKTREKDGSYGKIVKMTVSGSKRDIKTVMTIKEDFGAIKGEKKEYKLLGTYFLLADIKRVIDEEVPFAISLAFIVVFLTIMVMFRSLKSAFFILMPLTAGLFYMIFLAYISGTYLTLFNMIVIPTIIGMGIDASIHIFHRYKLDGRDAIPKILETTGGAVFFSSLTTFTGFMSMAFATHRGIKSIGIMASIGIATVTLTTLLLFPVILRLSKKLNKQ